MDSRLYALNRIGFVHVEGDRASRECLDLRRKKYLVSGRATQRTEPTSFVNE